MKTTEVNKELIGRRCECIFTGLMVTGVIEDTEENEHTIEVKVRFDHPHHHKRPYGNYHGRIQHGTGKGVVREIHVHKEP